MSFLVTPGLHTMELDVTKVNITAKPRKLKATYTMETDFSRYYNKIRVRYYEPPVVSIDRSNGGHVDEDGNVIGEPDPDDIDDDDWDDEADGEDLEPDEDLDEDEALDCLL